MTSPPAPAPETEAPVSVARCLNCETPLSGRFCAECGQEARDPRPTTRELLRDAAGELFNWDGKLLGTLRVLVAKPGRLTSELLAGHRARYLPPLRVYLICSVAFFAVKALLPDRSPVKVRVTAPTDSATVAKRESMSAADRAKWDAAAACALASSDSARGSLAVRLSARAACRAQDGSSAYMPELSTYYPRIMFVLLPIYALILSLVYANRRYPEHLYFALHIHAFVFVVLIIRELIVAMSIRPLSQLAGIAIQVVILAYSFVALRRVYGGSPLLTVGKTVLITGIYLVVFIFTLAIAALIALLN